MVVTGANAELVVVYIFSTDTPVYLLKFLLETSRSVAETLEHSGDTARVVVFILHTLLVVLCRFPLFLLRIRRNEQLVCVGRYREAVKFVDRHHQGSTQSHVCWNKLTVVTAAECYLTTDVADVQTDAELTFARTDVDIVVIVAGEVGSEGVRSRALLCRTVLHVGHEETHAGSEREFLAQHQRISHIKRHLVWVDGLCV